MTAKRERASAVAVLSVVLVEEGSDFRSGYVGAVAGVDDQDQGHSILCSSTRLFFALPSVVLLSATG